MEHPYCFVIMPFGEKNDIQGAVTDFDVVYEEIIEEVMEKRLEIRCLRSDKVQAPGWIHRDMLQHIVQADQRLIVGGAYQGKSDFKRLTHRNVPPRARPGTRRFGSAPRRVAQPTSRSWISAH